MAEPSSGGMRPSGGGDRDLLPPGPTFEAGGEAFDPAQRGFTAVHNYALYFWRPYLGNTAFGLWELLISFCFGDTDTAFPSLSRLSRMLTNSDHSRAVVTGRRGYRGALERLQHEGLVQVFRRGQGPTTRYTFRMCTVLPLLRPEQVGCLSPGLQRDHASWLERMGIDLAAYRGAFPVRESPRSLDEGERSPHCGADRDASCPGDSPAPPPHATAREAASREAGEVSPGTRDKASLGTRDKATRGARDKASLGTRDKATRGARDKATLGTRDKASLGTRDKASLGTRDKASRGRRDEVPHGARGDAPRSRSPPPVGSSGAAPGNTPVSRKRARAAPRSKGEERHSANNTQEEEPMTIWWKETIYELKKEMEPEAWRHWFAGSRAVAFHDGELTAQAPSAWARDSLEHRLATVVRRLLVAVSDGRVQKVRFVYEEGGVSCPPREGGLAQ